MSNESKAAASTERTEIATKLYIYLTMDGVLLGIKGKRRPSEKHNRTYVVYENNLGKWIMPPFPEVVPSKLSVFVFIGSVPLSKVTFI